jgi:hypothetical protein
LAASLDPDFCSKKLGVDISLLNYAATAKFREFFELKTNFSAFLPPGAKKAGGDFWGFSRWTRPNTPISGLPNLLIALGGLKTEIGRSGSLAKAIVHPSIIRAPG